MGVYEYSIRTYSLCIFTKENGRTDLLKGCVHFFLWVKMIANQSRFKHEEGIVIFGYFQVGNVESVVLRKVLGTSRF